MKRPATLAGLLRDRAAGERGGDIAIRFWEGSDWESWSWAEYWHQALVTAARFQGAGVRPGDRVLVLLPDVKQAVRCVFGLWTLGAVPIQVGLPYRMGDIEAFIGQLGRSAERLEARALAVPQMFASMAGPAQNGSLRIIDVDAFVDSAFLAAGAPHAGEPDTGDVPDPDAAPDPALIQLTSGSTGDPRGVMIAHDRLVLHMESMSRALPSHERSVAVSWLPLSHDMGLIGGLLFPFYNGFPAHMHSPLDFRRRPLRWLETMSEVKGTICAAPPSAYAIAMRQASKAVEAGLDLRAWEVAMVGAEPIAGSLLREFSDALAPCGFRPEAWFPVYGLAEATVAVTFPKLLDPTRFDRVHRPTLEREGRAVPSNGSSRSAGDHSSNDSVEFVGVGAAIPNTELHIAGHDGEVLGERRVGEILVRSKTLMTGYFRDPAATEASFSDGWLKTGDLGYLAGGSLFVVGRKKELVIIGGRNLIPSVIEDAVAQVDGIRTGCVAAVGILDPALHTERLWVVAETHRDPAEHDALGIAIRRALAADGVVADRVILVGAGELPKTTSGKIQRSALARQLAAS